MDQDRDTSGQGNTDKQAEGKDTNRQRGRDTVRQEKEWETDRQKVGKGHRCTGRGTETKADKYKNRDRHKQGQ
jgi:hypothetical protein